MGSPSHSVGSLSSCAPSARAPARERWLCVLLLAALAFVAWRRLHVPAWNASNLWIVPDSVEFAVAGERLAHLGSYSLEIEGVAHPPKSASWFGPLCLTPVYALFGSELGLGIHVVFAFALLALAVAFALGRLAGGIWGGALAALGLVLHPQFERWSREILSDVPALALGLTAAWLYARKPRERSLREDAFAGLVVALALALRSIYAAALLPFLWAWWRAPDRRATRLAWLALPSVAAVCATALYNLSVFGSAGRTGYPYWCAVPYDYRELAFGSRYVSMNLRLFAQPALWIPLAALALGVLLTGRRQVSRAQLVFLALAALPGSLFHLFHFYPGTRFHLLLVGGALVAAAGFIGALAPAALRRHAWLAAPLILAAGWWPARPELQPPVRRVIADALLAATPEDAVVVTAIEPVFLEPYFRGSRRRVVPAHRGVEYASKLVVPLRIAAPVPFPTDPFDHRASGLRAGGAREAVEFTADERPEQLARWVREGRPVFVDTSFGFETRLPQLLRREGLSWKSASSEAQIVQLFARPTKR